MRLRMSSCSSIKLRSRLVYRLLNRARTNPLHSRANRASGSQPTPLPGRKYAPGKGPGSVKAHGMVKHRR